MAGADDELLPTLKARDQWVCWTYEERDGDKTKPPIAPVDGQRYAKSNDPDTWGSYEDAVEYHDRDDTDTEGVGFMLDEEGVVAGVDLDGCRHPDTGDLESWAEDIIDRLDTYAEVSPSQSGVRAFLLGFLPDGRNKQRQERTIDLPEWVQEQKNAEVELYDSVRYMTFTGDHLEGTPKDAEQRSDTLKEIHAEYVAEDDAADDENQAELDFSDTDDETTASSDDGDDGGRSEFENEFGTSLSKIREYDEKLDRLLTDLEPGYNLPNDDNSASGYDHAAASKLYFWRFSARDIKRIMRRYRSRQKLKRDDYLERTIQNAAGGEQCDPPGNVTGEDEADSRVAANALDSYLQPYEHTDEDEGPSGAERARIGKLLALVDDDDLGDLRDRAADVLGTTSGGIDEHRRLTQHRMDNGPVIVEDGATWYIHGTPARRSEILNFELDVNSFLEVPGDPMRADVDIKPQEGPEFNKQIEPLIFNKRQRFDDELLAERFGLTFTPGDRDWGTVLDEINKYIATRDAPVREGTRHLGRHADEFVVPEGSLTPDGWTDDPTKVYLERDVGIERRVSIPTGRADYDADAVARIVEDLPDTRPADRILPVLGWFYATPFRPEIYDWEGGYNILNVTGDTGSGKTTTLRYLWRCFGMEGEPFDASDTWFVLISTYGATNSIPVWHDEYKPSDMRKHEVDRFHDAVRKTATGSVAQRGNADKSTEEYEMQAPAVVSGEQQIQPPAERRRSIMVQFRKDTTDVGTSYRDVFKELIGSGRIEDGELVIPEGAPDTTDHALAYWQWATSLDTDEIRDRWHDARRTEYDIRESWDEDFDLDDLEIQGLQTVVFGWNLYRDFADHVAADVDALPGEDALEDALQHIATAVGPHGTRKSHLDRFVELFARAAAADYVENERHYTIVRPNRTTEEIRLHIERTYDALSKYARDHGLDNEELLGAAAYRDRFQQAHEAEGGYVVEYSQNSPPIGRAVGVSTVEAMRELNFNRAAFDLDPIDEGEFIESSDDGDGGDGDPAQVDGSSGQQAAADGGVTEGDQLKARVLNHLRDEYNESQIASPAKVAGEMSEDPERVETVMETLSKEGRYLRPKPDGTGRYLVG